MKSKPTKQELIDHVESLVAKCAELTRERDAARRMYCERMSNISRQQDCTPQWFAEEQGWDCFKENTDYLQDLG